MTKISTDSKTLILFHLNQVKNNFFDKWLKASTEAEKASYKKEMDVYQKAIDEVCANS